MLITVKNVYQYGIGRRKGGKNELGFTITELDGEIGSLLEGHSFLDAGFGERWE